ncbi:conserved exported hypothetical protein [Frankia canadensis]|uniref:DUF305 domain-containing protein n=1 Tax=Frankia canadensis TaxID=1836972 RepID=A0A2I2KWE8_9ACTN|nr:DUF305 domain-containing protein [Frankia canadensis]SNQ49982.1 conserved exported hypothetical protein [Frankia canadensis]SOU57272.1 conserved exported hypothetical protein [Frankia canadensis]
MRRLALLLSMIATAALLAACGGNDSDDPGSGAHNGADTTFTQHMIIHHRQAIEMADLAPTRPGDGRVETLVDQIRTAQTPQITTMTSWLKAWGQATEPAQDDAGDDRSMPGPAGHDHVMPNAGTTPAEPMGTMDGMMSDLAMTTLRNTSGTAFDRMFLTMMIEHHQGALAMASRELRDGVNPAARSLATDIKSAQTSEITRMRELLKGI